VTKKRAHFENWNTDLIVFEHSANPHTRLYSVQSLLVLLEHITTNYLKIHLKNAEDNGFSVYREMLEFSLELPKFSWI